MKFSQEEAIGMLVAYEDAAFLFQIGAWRSAFEALGLRTNSSLNEVKRRYRDLALLAHPDKCTIPTANVAFRILIAINRRALSLFQGNGGVVTSSPAAKRPEPESSAQRESERHEKRPRAAGSSRKKGEPPHAHQSCSSEAASSSPSTGSGENGGPRRSTPSQSRTIHQYHYQFLKLVCLECNLLHRYSSASDGENQVFFMCVCGKMVSTLSIDDNQAIPLCYKSQHQLQFHNKRLVNLRCPSCSDRFAVPLDLV